MGTTYHITLSDTSISDGDYSNLLTQIDSVLTQINQTFSTYIESSEISQFNQLHSTKSMRISTDFAMVLSTALKVSRETQGAFDPTVMPLINAMGFGYTKPNTTPTAAQLDSITMNIGYEYIRLDSNLLHKTRPKVQLDLSANAKGFGIDKVIDFLKTKRFKHLLVEIGGEVSAFGNKYRNEKWQIGIDTPNLNAQPGKDFSRIISLNKGGMATSGDYRNYHEVNGVRISHILDAQTSLPLTHGLASVTVIAQDAMTADAYATAFMILGETRAMKLAESIPDLEAFFIVRKNGKYFENWTKGFEAYFVASN